ncbi:MAG: hypothetical protein ACTMUB_10110 [cyanobacterium endosymbiont of Rhopalodia musculus]|uniref:hypothetical protein n=1 Tax=cyanobacterium endosymbiont of Epithemia clementina EcSB TaxID=3034674 RepID=UPI00247FEBBA|nr:hypothetical protein [cyanobacterium endosymbiont of Epithemia clementina EcSB]WGT68381.1 hypothetical protein P3F56_04895 [cyanobacterium endosymbiont of Epithemia clementina EcSB]
MIKNINPGTSLSLFELYITGTNSLNSDNLLDLLIHNLKSSSENTAEFLDSIKIDPEVGDRYTPRYVTIKIKDNNDDQNHESNS